MARPYWTERHGRALVLGGHGVVSVAPPLSEQNRVSKRGKERESEGERDSAVARRFRAVRRPKGGGAEQGEEESRAR
jgi:hypothetical protein